MIGERVTLESCICGACFYCPDGWHGELEACGCTADCVLGTDRCECGACDRCAPTVKRVTLFDGVVDTFATEAELNGWRPSQGRML